MVTARGVSNGLDTVAHIQKRRVLPSESSRTHLGRRGETSITLRISSAIFKITLFPRARVKVLKKSSSESIIFIAVFHAELHWQMKYTKKNIELSTSHHPCPRPYSFCMKISSVRMQVLKKILESEHGSCSPTSENQSKTNEHE